MNAEDIRTKWKTAPSGYAVSIESHDKFKSWVIRIGDEYGVAMPISEECEICEHFSGAELITDDIILDNHTLVHALILKTSLSDIEVPFSMLCAELLNPGPEGIFRIEIENNPVAWWRQWKELLGNKSVDERVYDALGELYTLLTLAKQGYNPEWNGPKKTTYDIDCGEEFYEVKSTLSKSSKVVTLSNLFQLDPPDDHKLYLVLCQFESAQIGLSIDRIVDELEMHGYSKADLNEKLAAIGLEKGKSARKRCYIIHAMTRYHVDDSFPAIRQSSFVGGVQPPCVLGFTYRLSLDSIQGCYMLD